MCNYEIIELRWDNEYFGNTFAKVNLFCEISEKDFLQILDLTKKYAMISFSNKNNNSFNNFLISQHTSAFLVDVNIQFSKVVQKNDYNSTSITIQNCCPYDEDLFILSKTVFKYSKFFNDHNFNQLLAKDVYSMWAKNAFNRVDKYFAIYKIENKSIGAIIFSINFDTATIELAFNNPHFANCGYASALVQAVENFCFSASIKNLVVGTQLENIAGQNFYIKNGFLHNYCSSIYHWWR